MKIETPVDDYVARLVAEAPQISPAQLDRLAVLLRGRSPAYPSDPRRELDFREEQAGRLRRQAAARRLEALDDGRRDPLSESA
jgi:hypothetical protein